MYTLVMGVAAVCEELCGNNSLMADGVTTVDVIMKNINRRNIKSVIEDMLNDGFALCLCFIICKY